MEQDLQLDSTKYSVVLLIFFIGYLLFEVPSNMILARSRPSLFLPALMFTWGGLSIAPVGIHNFGGMVAFRFILGLIEAGFFPGVMLLLSCWYKPRELSKRIALFYTAALLSGAFGGLLAGGIISSLNGRSGIAGWRWLFLIEGLMTVFVAVVAVFVLPDYPATTKWLTPRERQLATMRLQAPESQGEEEPHMGHWKAFLASISDLKTWVFVIIYNLINMVGTIQYFYPTLMQSLGYTGKMAQYMTVPIYTVTLVVSVICGFIADRTHNKGPITMFGCALACVSFIITVAVPNDHAKYAFICFGAAGIWTAVPCCLSWAVTMFDGREKRGVSIALINGLGNLASVYGSWFWPSDTAPKYIMGFALCSGFAGFVFFVTWFAYWRYGDKGVQRKS